MKIVSVRLGDAEYVSLLRRAGNGRGALSKLIRRLLAEPPQVARTFPTSTTTSGRCHIVWDGPGRQDGNTLYLRAS